MSLRDRKLIINGGNKNEFWKQQWDGRGRKFN